jgi:hypothetical protein
MFAFKLFRKPPHCFTGIDLAVARHEALGVYPILGGYEHHIIRKTL